MATLSPHDSGQAWNRASESERDRVLEIEAARTKAVASLAEIRECVDLAYSSDNPEWLDRPIWGVIAFCDFMIKELLSNSAFERSGGYRGRIVLAMDCVLADAQWQRRRAAQLAR